MDPIIALSTSTLSKIRRFDNRTVYEFVLDATNYNATAFIWTNQKDFNDLKFEFQSIFETPEDLLDRPVYVHKAAFGVVDNDVKAVVSSIPRGSVTSYLPVHVSIHLLDQCTIVNVPCLNIYHIFKTNKQTNKLFLLYMAVSWRT